MCKIIEDFCKEERKETQKEIALRMLKAGKNSLEEIAEFVGFSLDELRRLEAEQRP